MGQVDPFSSCELCPRRCRVNRATGRTGVCGVPSQLRLARVALHFWEEPPISGEKGSGAVFFSGCPLRCVFCQNHEISSEGFGREVGVSRLAAAMLELQAQGAHNINLVTALHYAPKVKEALLAAKDAGLHLPVVCNTSGYELVETIEYMADVVDVWLPDFKYADPQLAASLSGARDYPQVAAAALEAMVAAVDARGGRLMGEDDLMKRGIIVRHLVLPTHSDDSCAVLDRVWQIARNRVDLSVMNQYTPNEQCRRRGGALAQTLDDLEYEVVLCHADDLGFEHLWWQEGGTVSESFVPAFDATGVCGADLGDLRV